MRIGELAKLAGVSPEAIRFYERQRVLPAPRRKANGYRDYGPEAVDALRFITMAKELGFTLDEIAQAMPLFRHGVHRGHPKLRALLEMKLAEIDGRIARYLELRANLRRLLERCASKDEAAQGPSAMRARQTARSSMRAQH